MSKAFNQFWNQNGLSQKYIEASQHNQQDSNSQSQRKLSIKNVLKTEISKSCGKNCPSFLKLEDENIKKHSLENKIEEYMVSNRMLQTNINLMNDKYYNLKLKHSKCEQQRLDTKEHIEKLEQDLTLLSEKWAKLSTLK